MGLAMNSVRGKLFLCVLVSSVVALTVTGVAMLVHDMRSFHETWVNDLTTQAELLGLANVPALQFNDAVVAQENMDLLRARPRILAGALFDGDGERVAAYRFPNSDGGLLPHASRPEGARVVGRNIELVHNILVEGELLGTVYLLGRYEAGERLRDYGGSVLSAAILALGVALLLSLWLQKAITGPILQITGVARQVVENRDYSLRAQRHSKDEIGYLVDAFNDLLDEVTINTEALREVNRLLKKEIRERRHAEREVRLLNDTLEHRVALRTVQLQAANRELESFSYSVSHDLRAPLRAIDGFSQALLEDHAGSLDGEGASYLRRVRSASQRMAELIDDLLKLAQVSRSSISLTDVDLTALAREVAANLRESEPDRAVELIIADDLRLQGDPRLLRIVMENLLGNAWKFTSTRAHARIEVGCRDAGAPAPTFFVADNGVGFDMAYVGKLFGAFQRLHGSQEFPGTGIGLATVQRVLHKHGGLIWAEAKPDQGATFYFKVQQGDGVGD